MASYQPNFDRISEFSAYMTGTIQEEMKTAMATLPPPVRDLNPALLRQVFALPPNEPTELATTPIECLLYPISISTAADLVPIAAQAENEATLVQFQVPSVDDLVNGWKKLPQPLRNLGKGLVKSVPTLSLGPWGFAGQLVGGWVGGWAVGKAWDGLKEVGKEVEKEVEKVDWNKVKDRLGDSLKTRKDRPVSSIPQLGEYTKPRLRPYLPAKPRKR